MSEEEKEAIERLDYFEPDDLVECAMYRDCVEKIKKLIEKQQQEIEDIKDKIREIIVKYVDAQEHFKYTNQELYGKELRNMIKELLEV